MVKLESVKYWCMNAWPTPKQAHLPIEESDQSAVFPDFYCRLASDPLLARHHLCDPEARHEPSNQKHSSLMAAAGNL
jgi:hypothetical protein